MKKSLLILSCVALLSACSSNSEKETSADSAAVDTSASITTSTDTTLSVTPTDTAAVTSNSTTRITTTTATTTSATTPAVATPAAKVATPAAPAAAKSNTVIIDINTVPEAMQFDVKTFTVKVGQKVIINISNSDSQQHNFVLTKPGSFNKVGAAADAMMRDPSGEAKNWVPSSPDILEATRLLGPDESGTVEFTVPNVVGDYHYMCTFPGHWRMMNGIMKVIK